MPLKAIEDTVVLRDVVECFGVRNASFLRNLVRYCADSVGTLLSAKRIADYLTLVQEGHSVGVGVLGNRGDRLCGNLRRRVPLHPGRDQRS